MEFEPIRLEPKGYGHSCLVPPLTLLGLGPMLHSATQMESICEGLGSPRLATPVGEWNVALCSGLMFWAAMPSLYWCCLFHDEHWKCVSMKGRPGVILGSPCSFSESTAFEFHTMHFLYRNFDLWSFAATCYGTRQLNVDNVGVPALDHVAGWCSWLLPCLRAPGRGGAWVPGGLRPVFWFFCCFSIMIQA